MNEIEIPTQASKSTLAKAALAETNGIVAAANAIQVTGPAEYESAVDACRNLARSLKDLEEERLKITDPLRHSINGVMDFFKRLKAPREQADQIIRRKLRDYDNEQVRIAAIARRKAQEQADAARRKLEEKTRADKAAADKKAADERAAAERQRQEQARLQREADEAKRRGDAAAAQASQRAADEARIAAAKAEQKAEQITAKAELKQEQQQDRASSIVATVIVADKVKVSGQSRRKVWKYRVIDASKVNRQFMMLDEPKILKTVKALGKEAVETVGGIECWQEDDLSIAAAKP